MKNECMYTRKRPDSKYPKMPMSERAAQFAPFAALTGHKEIIEEKEREKILVTRRILSDEEMLTLNDKIIVCLKKQANVKMTYFVGVDHLQRGYYETKKVRLKRFDETRRMLVCKENLCVPIDDIVEIDILEH